MLAPWQTLLQLRVGQLLRGANGGPHHVLVFLGQPAGFTGQVDIDVKVQRRDEFSRIVADNHLPIIDNGDG